jgi:hypothetical protein
MKWGYDMNALRHKLIADLFELPVWERGKQWKPDPRYQLPRQPKTVTKTEDLA